MNGNNSLEGILQKTCSKTALEGRVWCVYFDSDDHTPAQHPRPKKTAVRGPWSPTAYPEYNSKCGSDRVDSSR